MPVPISYIMETALAKALSPIQAPSQSSILTHSHTMTPFNAPGKQAF